MNSLEHILTSQEAAAEAMKRLWGAGPYLIRAGGCGGHNTPVFLEGECPSLVQELIHIWVRRSMYAKGFDPNYQPGAPLILPAQQLYALVDTGASISSNDEGLARAQNLTVVSSVRQLGIGGEVKGDVCLAQIEIPSLEIVFNGRFATLPLAEEGHPYSAILGQGYSPTLQEAIRRPGGHTYY